MDDVLGQVRVVRVPHQADGDDLRAVEENPGHAELLATAALRRRQTLEVEPWTPAGRRRVGVAYGTAAEVAHAGVTEQLPEHAGGGLLPGLHHLHRLVTKEEEQLGAAVFIMIDLWGSSGNLVENLIFNLSFTVM